jgi:hypothetical protein
MAEPAEKRSTDALTGGLLSESPGSPMHMVIVAERRAFDASSGSGRRFDAGFPPGFHVLGGDTACVLHQLCHRLVVEEAVIAESKVVTR